MTRTETPRRAASVRRSAPILPKETIEREPVLARLLCTHETPLVSVVAPAGYGKTTVLAQWAVAEERTVAWLTVEPTDDDPVVLVRDIASAIDEAGIAATPQSVGRHRAGTSIWSRLVPALWRQMSEGAPFVLVLDDVHELSAQDALDVVAELPTALPRGSTLALSGRTEITPLVARARPHRAVLELGTPDLGLDLSEATRLLGAAGVALEDDEVSALHRRTEGWAAGLALAAMAHTLDGGEHDADDPAEVDRFVEDFLRLEALSNVDAADLTFMVRSSALDRMSGPLCDAVLERHDSQARLEAIERFNRFLVPLDHRRTWYRYHELFRAALLRELERDDPTAADRLRLRAADWLAANGLPEDAMRSALAANDLDRASRLLVAHAVPLYRQGRAATVEGWMTRFEAPELLARHPAVAALGAFLHALSGRAFQAERWLDAARWSPRDGPLPDGSAGIEAWVALVDAFLCRHGPARMAEDAERAFATLGPMSPFRPVALMLHATALLLLGERRMAATRLEEAADAAKEAGATLAGANALAQLALLALDGNDLVRARRLVDRAQSLADPDEFEDYMAAGLLLATRARLEAAEGNHDDASRTLTALLRLRPQLTHAIPFNALQTLLEGARAHLELAQTAAARAALEQARDIVDHRADLGILVDQLEAERRRAAGTTKKDGAGWESSLTAAELRLLPFLTTHLTFREIGERLFVSRNTVKTQAISIYRKLDASSRGEAVRRAAELGLVDTPPLDRRVITPSG